MTTTRTSAGLEPELAQLRGRRPLGPHRDVQGQRAEAAQALPRVVGDPRVQPGVDHERPRAGVLDHERGDRDLGPARPPAEQAQAAQRGQRDRPAAAGSAASPGSSRCAAGARGPSRRAVRRQRQLGRTGLGVLGHGPGETDPAAWSRPPRRCWRPGLLDGCVVAIAGGARAVADACASLGAATPSLEADLLDEDAVTAAAQALGRADVLVCDAAAPFAAAGGGLPALRTALDGAWNAVRAVANAALRPAGGGKVVLLAPAPGAGEHARGGARRAREHRRARCRSSGRATGSARRDPAGRRDRGGRGRAAGGVPGLRGRRLLLRLRVPPRAPWRGG